MVELRGDTDVFTKLKTPCPPARHQGRFGRRVPEDSPSLPSSKTNEPLLTSWLSKVES